MPSPIYVTCPTCKGRYYLRASDFLPNPEAYCLCPFCKAEFTPQEGKATIDGKLLTPSRVSIPEG